jgi:hypothetical protein
VTFAAVKKLAFKLPRRQRLRLAAELSSPDPILPGSVGIEELERRIDEVESGKVKPVTWGEFQRTLDKMRKSVKGARASEAPSRARKTRVSRVLRSA